MPYYLNKYQQILKNNPLVQHLVFILSIALFPASLAIIWLAWVKAIPIVWNWAFTKLSFKIIPGSLGILSLVIIPPSLPFGAFSLTDSIVSVYAEKAEEQLKDNLEKNSRSQYDVEEELIKNDEEGLILLLRYSRFQLESYYVIGLNQTQQSFRNSVFAMWIGFAVIIFGIVIRVVDLKQVGLIPIDTNMSTLIIVSGAIIEVISALFLWVYRNSLSQLNYFYNRQMYNHNVLMSQRIAATMENSDESKKIIVEKLLDRWELKPNKLPSGISILSSLKKN